MLRHLHCLKKKLLFYIYAVIVKQKKTEWCRIYYSLTQCRRVRAAIQTQNEWSGGPEAGTLGAGSVGVGGYGWLCWLVAGLRRVPSAWLRCAWTLWAVAGRTLTQIYFGRNVRRKTSRPSPPSAICGRRTQEPETRDGDERWAVRDDVVYWYLIQ